MSLATEFTQKFGLTHKRCAIWTPSDFLPICALNLYCGFKAGTAHSTLDCALNTGTRLSKLVLCSQYWCSGLNTGAVLSTLALLLIPNLVP